eukprot:1172316-Lingulodinium_polyedra.AAC.1
MSGRSSSPGQTVLAQRRQTGSSSPSPLDDARTPSRPNARQNPPIPSNQLMATTTARSGTP